MVAAIYKNSMEIITNRTRNEPTHAAIYTFYSAAPTMTNSRVEALGTGSQPPYLTIATSFSHAEARDDNLISQLNTAGYRIHLVGDSLWGTIYPKRLYASIDSSSAYSQKSLDDYVNARAHEKLKEKNWDFLITHVNELDHLSHKYTFNSQQAVNQLRINDKLIERNINTMSNETLLLAFGDHGSTIAEGSHGGGTKEEIESGFFGYTKKGFTFKNFKFTERLSPKTRELLDKLKLRKEKLFDFLERDAFFQYDIVPTTAAMFNVPIPFKNLGLIIPELLHYEVSESSFISESLFELMMDHLVNFLQAYHYDGIAYNEHNEMKQQWLYVSGVYEKRKESIPKAMERLRSAMQVEEQHFKSEEAKMAEEQWNEYAQTIELAVDSIVAMRDALTVHRRDFTDQWCAINMVYLYGSWILRIMLSLSLALFIFVTAYVIAKKRYELMARYNYYKVAIVAQVILILIIAFQYKLDNFTIPLSFMLCLYTLFVQLMVIYTQFPEILNFAKSSSKLPLLGSIAVYVYCTVCMDKVSSSSNFSPHLGIFSESVIIIPVFVIALVFARVGVKKLLVGVLIAGLMLYISVHSAERWPARDSFEAVYWRPYVVYNYWVSSFIPMMVIVAALLFFLFKRTYGLKSSVKLGYAGIFLTEIFLILVYQHYEIYYKRDQWPYWDLILLPRCIYLVSMILLFYGFVSVCKHDMVYAHYPQTKEQRIVSLFTLLLIAVLPILLIINGPHLQILYLVAFIMAVGSAYCFKGTFMYNSILHYTIYIVLGYRLYFVSGHKLDFLNPKITRTFVGFPEFNLIITFSITIMDFIAIIVFLLALLPIVSINLDDNSKDFGFGILPSMNMEVDRNHDIEAVKIVRDDGSLKLVEKTSNEDEAVLLIGRNYAIAMLFIDIMQDYFTRYLVFNFELHFFDVSHVDFTFRFVNWAVYFVIILNCFLSGKA
eukprot:TRINITY_DN1474_c0_g1_i1.p1 TRINITY_DN1474_c0_g1~~TRINITY_DN1474_c0_g1_i1.p1  ORF type:complete len:943 (+),score=227.01 TRINITY_DN1474_c0_g1_i1:481-3309(+)